MTYHLLVASDIHHAHLTANIDWGWERMGPFSYRNPEGEEVRILKDVRDLYGLPRGIKLYLGHAAYEREDAHEIIEIATHHGAEII